MLNKSVSSLLALLVVLGLSTVVSARTGSNTSSSSSKQMPVTGPNVPGVEAYDKAITALMEKWKIPGAAVAVTKNGRLVLARGYGYADVENQVAVQPDSLFRIASLTKPITATAILHLVEQHKLDLDAKFLDILTDYKVPATADPRLKSITIRHLLEHAGGWDRDAKNSNDQDPMFRSIEIAKTVGAPAPATCNNIIQFMLGRPLDFDPGTKSAYSNFGYCILGRVIEKVTGQSYESYVRENVLAPMGIHSMRIGHTLLSGRAPGEVKYYDCPGAPLEDSVFPGGGKVPAPYGGYYLEAMDSHGGWIASAIDLTRFMTALAGQRGPSFLTRGSLLEMTARPDIPQWSTSVAWYGLGLNVRPAEVDANWWHEGALLGGATILVRSYNGYVWAAVYNSRPKDGGRFALDIDQVMWKALGKGLDGSPTDLYSQYPSPDPPPSQPPTPPSGSSKER